ncbi:GyrI-like domain-containing protein [Dyella sp. 2HG41-7]|uniref:AraC family transcriptional regulator n=1 Tax=Dyella sp. 2HG41-7 TaxID=2883239 RepID=UPI001F28EA82|nr:GyrI-like domain-containing protein [Dyella sp. 2HG41-7]
MSTETPTHAIRIVDFPETKVAVLQHHGDPKRIGDSIQTFVAWRKQQHLHPSEHATFNIFYNDPYRVASNDFRIDLCVAVDRDMRDDSLGIATRTLPANRCAVLRHVGTDNGLWQSVAYLYSEWLPQSGERAGDFPLFAQRVRFPPDVPEQEAVVDIFLPLK